MNQSASDKGKLDKPVCNWQPPQTSLVLQKAWQTNQWQWQPSQIRLVLKASQTSLPLTNQSDTNQADKPVLYWQAPQICIARASLTKIGSEKLASILITFIFQNKILTACPLSVWNISGKWHFQAYQISKAFFFQTSKNPTYILMIFYQITCTIQA